ncbi:hypothetical protein [uncultured Roseovarius sp.]|uniref:hypothetical protein n=1 Tax=uncultured Roseovarius sp. TaxID=293344 RepID=UPI00262BC974|nr:hypothetical protein [uncultured Roseovarius sp.]
MNGPGPEPLEDITPQHRERDLRIAQRLKAMGDSFDLDLEPDAVNELARLVLQESEEDEELQFEKMVPFFRAVAKAEKSAV